MEQAADRACILTFPVPIACVLSAKLGWGAVEKVTIPGDVDSVSCGIPLGLGVSVRSPWEFLFVLDQVTLVILLRLMTPAVRNP